MGVIAFIYETYENKVQKRQRLETLANTKESDGSNPDETDVQDDGMYKEESNEIRFKPNLCESLESVKYIDIVYMYYIRFINQNGSEYELTGHVEGTSVNGKVKITGLDLKVISGNTKGKFTLISDCEVLTGNISAGILGPTSFDYHRSNY